VKFKDAELIGVPYRITVGPRGLANDEVEVVRRRDGRKRSLDLHKAAEDVAETIAEERR
jgi:prolyl-tRNA synthetase